MLKYRPEIDGLRTIAVLSVLIYHAEIFISGHQLLRGGFLGVDIFFVISGFVVTGSILRGRPTTLWQATLRFYERRAKRLTPALVVVVVITAIVIATVIDLDNEPLTDEQWLTGIFGLIGCANLSG